MQKKAKVALVHDALVNMGGAERVVGIMHELFPEAPLFTTAYNPKKTYSIFRGVDIRTTGIQRVTTNEILLRLLMPFCLRQMRRFNLEDYDVVLSSAAWCAKNIVPKDKSLYICYCYAPFRLLWDTEHYFIFANRFFLNNVSHLLSKMRNDDFQEAQKVKYFITTCSNMARKIKKCYMRDAEVIHPPVDIQRYEVSREIGDYFLVVSRMVPYKRIDIAIEAFNELKYPLKVVGDGPERKKLLKLAGKNIEFLGNISDSQLAGLYSKSKALVQVAEEDYGLTPLESQASGRPVIAYGAGGVLDTVENLTTGLFFKRQDKNSLIEALCEFNHLSFDPMAIRSHAEKFDIHLFKNRILDFIKEKAVRENIDVQF